MEASACFSREALEKELAGQKLEDLQEMGRRLFRSHSALQEVLADLEAERKALQEEKVQLNQTISMFMRELQKLNISSDNTVEPMLDEGPLGFVGRIWEKVKPRGTAVVVNEHMGEIRKPGYTQEPQANGGLVALVRSRVEAASAAAAGGSLGSSARAAATAALAAVTSAAASAGAAAAASAAPAAAGAGTTRAPTSNGAGSAARAGRGPASNGTSAGASGAVAAEVSGPSEAPQQAEAAEDPQASEEAAATAPASSAVLEEPPSAEPSGPSSTEEQISSTILIEAQLKLDDGSVQTLHVRAADRCKEVAHLFVQEHSLKAWFEEPLTTWLKKVEADAVKFPVKVEGDLMEIRKQYSKGK